jgi:ADP-ribosylation factor family
MGGQMSKMMGKIFGSKEMRLLMLGLDAAGKTSTVPLEHTRAHPPVANMEMCRQQFSTRSSSTKT